MSEAMTPRLLRRDPDRVAVPAGLVDAHVHLTPVPPPTRQPGTAPPISPDDALAMLAEAGIDRAVGFPTQAPHYGAANAALRSAAAASGGRLLAAARLGGEVPVRGLRPGALRRSLRSRLAARPTEMDTLDGFAAVKLAPPVDGIPDEVVLAEVRARRLPVVVPAGASCPPRWVARVLLPRLTGCPVVLAHLGSHPASAPDLADAVALAREGRVWLDTSAAWLAGFIVRAVQEAPGRVLFGSAAPLIAPGVAWGHVAAAVTDDGALAHLASGAAAEVFGL